MLLARGLVRSGALAEAGPVVRRLPGPKTPIEHPTFAPCIGPGAQVEPASGKALSATNTLPHRNTTALVDDLLPGATYRFAVQSLSTAYDDGRAASIEVTLPKAGGAAAAHLPPRAPRAVQRLQAAPAGAAAAQVGGGRQCHPPLVRGPADANNWPATNSGGQQGP